MGDLRARVCARRRNTCAAVSISPSAVRRECRRRRTMRFIITASPGPGSDTTNAAAPDMEVIAAHMRFNEEMHKAGVLVASEGLNPEGKGARVGVVNGKRAVLDGPFAESKELVGGFYLIEVASRDEAI